MHPSGYIPLVLDAPPNEQQRSCPPSPIPGRRRSIKDTVISLDASHSLAPFRKEDSRVPDDGPDRRCSTKSYSVGGKAAKKEKSKGEEAKRNKDSCLGCLYSFKMIDPTKSSGLFVWDGCMALCLIIVALMSPYEAAFLEPQLNALFYLNRCVDAIFGIDIILQFLTAKEDPTSEGMLLQDPIVIAKEYMSGWFWVDVISILPVDTYFVLADGLGNSSKLTAMEAKMARMLRIVRLLRLNKIQRLMTRWQTSVGVRYAMISLFGFIGVIFMTSHWMSCLWGGIGLNYMPEHSWLAALKAAKGGDDSMYTERWDVYLLSFYWAIMTITSIGYGDITPQNRLEYTVASMCMLCMAFVWAYVIGGICGVVATMQPHDIAFKQTMDDLNDLMDDHDMPRTMRKDLRAYLHQSRFLNRQRIERAVVDQLSPSLQGEVALYLHEYFVQKVPYLRGLDREVHIEVSRSLRMMVYPPYESISRSRTLYILRHGLCMHKGKVLSHGAVWGVDHLLHNPNLRESDAARALSYVNVLMLHASDVYRLMDKFPSAQYAVRWRKNIIAITRGVKKLARVAEEVGFGEFEAARERMTTTQRSQFVSDVINSRFTALSQYDHPTIRRSMCALLDKKDSGESHPDFMEALATTVFHLSKQVTEIQHTQGEMMAMIQGLRL